MNDWNTTVTQIREFITQHLPPDALSNVGVGALVAVLAGVILCVLGAKLARVGLVGAWVVVGGLLGAAVARKAGIHPIPGVLLFGAGLGVIGHMTYRLWVGMLTAGVITAAVLGAFGFQRLGPYVGQFNQDQQTGAMKLVAESANTQDGFTVPSPAEQDAYRSTGELKRKVRELWTYATTQDASLSNHGAALGWTALIFGLLVGLSTVRYTLIFSTSMLGTILLGSGIVGAVGSFWPGFTKAALQSPIIDASALGVCLIISIIMQLRLTRPPKTETKEAAA